MSVDYKSAFVRAGIDDREKIMEMRLTIEIVRRMGEDANVAAIKLREKLRVIIPGDKEAAIIFFFGIFRVVRKQFHSPRIVLGLNFELDLL